MSNPIEGPAPMCIPVRGDEVTPIITYMVDEMNTNAHSLTARKIHDLNTFTMQQCLQDWQQQSLLYQFLMDPGGCLDREIAARAAAMLEWTLQVRTGGPWDHKVIIPKMFNPAVGVDEQQHYHHANGTLYYYDIWSNIHYGYVGAACSFSASVLLDGAGLEQIGSDLLTRFRWPEETEGVQGLRRFDDASDRAAITIGFNMWPHPATVAGVWSEVRATTELSTKSYQAAQAAATGLPNI